MKKVILASLIFGSTLMLTSCDPQTCGTDFIENHTSQTLFFLRADSATVDTFLPGKVLTFEQQCGLVIGSAPEHGYDYIAIRNADTVCKKDIRLVENWKYVKIGKRTWEYYFTVTDADF